MSSNKDNSKKNTAKVPFRRIVTAFVLLALVVIGLVSTTFASLVPENSSAEDGSIVAQIKTAVANRSKKDVADTKANVDVAGTSADTYHLAGTMNGWNTSSTQMTQGVDINGQTIYYSGYYGNQEQFKVVKNGGTWLGYEKQSSSIYSNSLTIYNYDNGGNCWPGSGGYYVVYNPTKDKISCVTVLPLKPDNPFKSGTVVYFDIKDCTAWTNDSAKMYVQFDSSTTGSTTNRAEMTKIGDTLYAYKFTSNCSNNIRFWRGTSTDMWNYSKSLSVDNGNGIKLPSSDNVNTGAGEEKTFTMTSLSQPTITANPNEFYQGSTTTLSSNTTHTLTYKVGSTSYTINANSSDIKYTFKNGSTTIRAASNVSTYSWKPSTVGTYTTYVTVSSTFTGLTSTSNGATVTVKSKYTYNIYAKTGGSVSPTSGNIGNGETITIKATPTDGYEFAGWVDVKNADIENANDASTSFEATATGATATAAFRPLTPTNLKLTGSIASGAIIGKGTSTEPYIVLEQSGFKLSASCSAATGASKAYSTSATSGYSSTSQFNPPLNVNKGVDQTYTVYAKAYVGEYYSTTPASATAHYMVFSNLNGENISFNVSSNEITELDTLTLSGADITGVDDAEKQYISHTYQISTDNSNFTDLDGNTWNPNAIGTYYFRVKTTNEKTGQTVYSISTVVTVKQSSVKYTITNDGTVNGTVELYSNDSKISGDTIPGNTKLSISLLRSDSNYYVEYLKVDGEIVKANINGDIVKYLAIEQVRNAVAINYKISEKPKVTVKKPTNSESISFKYLVDGKDETATSAGTYYVDYNSKITYDVTPSTGYYVSAMTGVTMGKITSSTVTGAKSDIKTSIAEVSATLTKNNTFIVNIASDSPVKDGGSITVGETAASFDSPISLNYDTETEVVITPPEGCYAVVSGNDVKATISTDGKATFKVTLTGEDKIYTVKFFENPKIFMVQPQYGSVYVTDKDGNYYFNGDSVGYGTELTVHAKKDHSNSVLSQILVNDSAIGTTDGSKFNIYLDSTATATITVPADFIFSATTQYGERRIFYTDNNGWKGVTAVDCNYTTDSGSTGTIGMTYKYTNSSSQRVYYADIPYSTKTVSFKAVTGSNYTNELAVVDNSNGFWTSGTNKNLSRWNFAYSDYIATDRADSIQQAVTAKGDTVTFSYSCDYGDDTLSAEVVSGNAATFDFDRGVLSITPTENTNDYTLAKVKSAASGTEKYYLIKVVNFEIVDFAGLQKIYNTKILNKLDLDIIVQGGVMNYAAKLFVSDSNKSGSYGDSISSGSGFVQHTSVQQFINSFLIQYQIDSISGVKYYKAEATDGAGHKAIKTLKTLFGTNTYNGERCIYFHNNSGKNISKYDLRACFNDGDNNHRFVTMQRVGTTDYYRAVIPNGFEESVNFYLTNSKTFSNNYADYDGSDDDTTETYYYAVFDVGIPSTDVENDYANSVYESTEIGANGIVGEFTEFDY